MAQICHEHVTNLVQTLLLKNPPRASKMSWGRIAWIVKRDGTSALVFAKSGVKRARFSLSIPKMIRESHAGSFIVRICSTSLAPPNALIGPSMGMGQHAGKRVQHMPEPERAWSSLARSYSQFHCQRLAPVLSFMLRMLEFTQIGLALPLLGLQYDLKLFSASWPMSIISH